MSSDREPSVLETIMTIFLITAIFAALILMGAGCNTTRCPECVPTLEIQRVEIPVRYCEPPPEIQKLNLPPWPTLPPNPTEDQIKEWYARCVSTVEAREKILLENVELYRKILDEYND